MRSTACSTGSPKSSARQPPRDAEAERLIDSKIGRQPGAPYYLAQTVIVQQQALEMAEQRIAELERQATQNRRGGLFGGLFGDGAEDERQVPAAPPVPR